MWCMSVLAFCAYNQIKTSVFTGCLLRYITSYFLYIDKQYITLATIRVLHIIDLENMKGLITKSYERRILADIALINYLSRMLEKSAAEVFVPELVDAANYILLVIKFSRSFSFLGNHLVICFIQQRSTSTTYNVLFCLVCFGAYNKNKPFNLISCICDGFSSIMKYIDFCMSFLSIVLLV